MKQKLDLETWKRKDHFHFFRKFEEPFFGVCIHADCTIAYHKTKAAGISFFLYYLHKSLIAANAIEPFRYRIEGDDAILYDAVHASPTINREDGTFGFAYMDYHEDFSSFEKSAQQEIDKVQNSKGLIPAVSGENVIHYSSVPWLNFTSLSHARAFSFKDSIPKISFGKMTEDSHGTRTMPVSVHAHHALMDGYHVGEFVNLFQQLLNER
ncbi:MAG: chloramphenicol O-acetyltransferase [Chitinophagaceae bacterium]|nr:chloramphenicol O-acetyltransferase [Chitinophagaceae bacterium]